MNGAGKSSLLKIMAGLDDGFTGEARKMMFNTDLASKMKQDQQDVTIENLKAEITAMKDRITALENA